MDIASPLAPAAQLSGPPSPAASSVSSDTTPPWRIEPEEAPRRSRASGLDLPRIEPQHVPWAIVALTLITAVLVVFGTREGATPKTEVVTFAQNAD